MGVRKTRKFRRNQRGGTTFVFEQKGPTTFYYYGLNAVPKTLRNRIKSSSPLAEKRNNLAMLRKFSYAKFLTSGDIIALPLMEKVNTRLQELGEEPLHLSRTYVLSWLVNNPNTSIVENAKTGTIVSEANARAIFEPNVYEGNEKQINFTKPLGLKVARLFFLQKGMGGKVLRYAMDDLKRKGAEAIILVCENSGLERYYQGFGFETISKIPFWPEYRQEGEKELFYGDKDTNSGPVMFKRL